MLPLLDKPARQASDSHKECVLSRANASLRSSTHSGCVVRTGIFFARVSTARRCRPPTYHRGSDQISARSPSNCLDVHVAQESSFAVATFPRKASKQSSRHLYVVSKYSYLFNVRSFSSV
eukprot:6201369-Pleurochrysis_carterae.AAC.1